MPQFKLERAILTACCFASVLSCTGNLPLDPSAPQSPAAPQHEPTPIPAPSPTPDPNAAPAPSPPAPSPPAPPVATLNPFVEVRAATPGAQLAYRGKPYQMLGYGADLANVTNYCGWQTDDLPRAFDAMRTNSNTNTVRIWFLQSAGGPNNWSAFDTAIAQAKSHGFLVIATLVNQWGDCEPNVNGQKNYKTLAWYQSGYKTASDGYPLAFRDYAKAVAEHYASEPTIAFWQLVNEAEARDPVSNSCPSESAAASAIRAFADDMVDVIHSVDTHHLINLGTQDNGYCGVSGDNYRLIHAGKIDLCEVHSYEPGNDVMPQLVQDKIAQCQALKKPIFMGEMGICRNVQADGSCSGAVSDATLKTRANFFDAKFKAGFAAGLSGMLIWQWSPNMVDTTYGVDDADPLEAVMQKY